MTVRDNVTGQYAFDKNFDRLCLCGHRLGAHVHGGFDCGANVCDYPETKGCDCVKFIPQDKQTLNEQFMALLKGRHVMGVGGLSDYHTAQRIKGALRRQGSPAHRLRMVQYALAGYRLNAKLNDDGKICIVDHGGVKGMSDLTGTVYWVQK